MVIERQPRRVELERRLSGHRRQQRRHRGMQKPPERLARRRQSERQQQRQRRTPMIPASLATLAIAHVRRMPRSVA